MGIENPDHWVGRGYLGGEWFPDFDGAGKPWQMCICMVIVGALSIPAGVLGGKMWGVAGVALGVVLASVIGNLVTVTLACASLRITLGEYLRGTCVKLLPPLILINAYCGLLPFISDVTGFLTLSLHVASVVLLYGALLWMCSIDRTVKVKIKEMIHANIINKNSRT